MKIDCQQRNFQKELDRIIEKEERDGRVPTLLLHSCCAPCSSYCLEYLSRHFAITDYYYNPNITEKAEYDHRIVEIKRLIGDQPHLHQVKFEEGPYEPDRFWEISKGYEACPEGTDRCRRCFTLRLQKACRYAAEQGFEYVTTTLTISPMKDEKLLNEIGEAAVRNLRQEGYAVKWLPSNFKKKGGYQRSVELSEEYQLYRQDYCGCVFSKRRDYVKLGRNSRINTVKQ